MTCKKKSSRKCKKNAFCFYPSNFKGPQGPPGPIGPQGPPGTNGFENLAGQRGDYLRYYNDTIKWTATATSTDDNILIGTTTADSFSASNTDNVAMGNTAGQGLYANPASTITDTISIGKNTGGSGTIFGGAAVDLEKDSIAIGNSAGSAGQQEGAISIGVGVNEDYSQQFHSVSIGSHTSKNGQSANSVMIGPFTGMAANVSFVGSDPTITGDDPTLIPGVRTVGIGFQAARFNEAADSVAVGTHTHASGSGAESVGIGRYAGSGYTILADVISETANTLTAPGVRTVDIGYAAGLTSQDDGGIAIGSYAGAFEQHANAIAIGTLAGANLDSFLTPVEAPGQGISAVAIGNLAGVEKQSNYAVAIGDSAGLVFQGLEAIAIGKNAGNDNQADYAIAIGTGAGSISQGTSSIAIGYDAGKEQGLLAIAIGYNFLGLVQGDASVAIGFNTHSEDTGVAIGSEAVVDAINGTAIGTLSYVGLDDGTSIGYSSSALGADGVALGSNATSTGTASIAIGTGSDAVNNNCIVINATAVPLSSAAANTCYIAPVRGDAPQAGAYTNSIPPVGFLPTAYNPTTKEFIYVNAT